MKLDDLPLTAAGPAAWRIGSSEDTDHTGWDAVAMAQALASEVSAPTLVFLPSGASTPYTLQQEAEAWALAGPPGVLRLDLLFRGDRVIWTPQRVLVIGAPERLPDVTAAVARFTRLQRELRAIEQAAHSNLLAAELDVALTHAVTAADLAQQPRVGTLTQAVHQSRIRITRLEASLAQPGERLSGASRRLVSELALQAEFAERLRTLDDQIEVAQDIYDTVNDRLTEFSHFLREYRIEILIVVVLALEVGLVVWDILRAAL